MPEAWSHKLHKSLPHLQAPLDIPWHHFRLLLQHLPFLRMVEKSEKDTLSVPF